MNDQDNNNPQNRTELTPRPDGRFVRGQSGNPGGRPKVEREVREVLWQNGVQAARRLVELMSSPDEKVALSAAQTLLDRTLGKPAQQVTSEGGGGTLLQLIAAFQRLPPAGVSLSDDDEAADPHQ